MTIRGQIQRMSALRAGLLAGVAFMALAGEARAAADAAAAAAVADADGGAALEEVVVTAEKREGNLQKTPIAISVMSADDLDQRHVQSLEDLQDGSLPSLRVAPFFARSSALTLGMRGIGALGDANQPARDQAVGVYINGVYLGRAQGLGSALYEVERIEVLKGPQGTLFGRNTEGGAVSIVTRKPSGEAGMRTVLGYGNYDSYKFETHVDLPSFNNIAVKLDALVEKSGGTVANPMSGEEDFNGYDKRGVQFEALWRPTDTFTADYAFDNSHSATTPYYVQLLSKGLFPLAPIMPLQPSRADTANVGVPLQPSIGNTFGHRLNLDWKVAGVELRSITAYRNLEQSQFDNGETALSVFAPNGGFSRYSLANVYQSQFSQELQLLGNVGQIQYVAGAFYYHEDVRDNAQTPNSMMFNATGTAATPIPLNIKTISLDRASNVKTKSYGVFGQAVWTPDIMEHALHLTLGGRLTHDQKEGSLDVVNGALPVSLDASGKVVVGPIALDESWSRFDPLVNIAIDVTPDVNLYGRWSTGYKAGGANSRSLTYRAFDPEHVSMFEVGAKTEFWDHRARVNVAAYYGDLKDVQVDFTVNTIVAGSNRGTLETTNAATGKTKGFEADVTVAPVEGLTLTASYAYTKVKLSQAFNPFINANSTVYPLFTPKNALSVAADYQHPAWGATFRAHIDGNYADGQYTSTTDPTLSDDSFIVNGRIALGDIRLTDQGAKLELAVWSRNLFNEEHVFLRNFNAALGTYGIFNEPRTYGVEARVAF